MELLAHTRAVPGDDQDVDRFADEFQRRNQVPKAVPAREGGRLTAHWHPFCFVVRIR